MEAVQDLLLWMWTFGGVKLIAAHVAINVLLAMYAEYKAGTFDFRRVADFIGDKLLIFVFGYSAVKMLGVAGGIEWLAYPIALWIETQLAADTADNLGKLGVPLPEQLAKLIGTH